MEDLDLKKAQEFIDFYNIKIDYHFIGKKKKFENLYYNHYIIVVSKSISKYFSFEYFDYSDCCKPNLYDLLCTLHIESSTPSQTLGDYIDEFEYSIASKKEFDYVSDSFNRMVKLREDVNQFFTEEELIDLYEF